ncbi:MAG TPA: hypothetical protein VK555_07990 [Terriglobales bacterium]|nr:hypothetical protein [Terriglobales bacterium]
MLSTGGLIPRLAAQSHGSQGPHNGRRVKRGELVVNCATGKQRRTVKGVESRRIVGIGGI